MFQCVSVCSCLGFFYCSLESTEDWHYNALLSLGQHSASWRVRIHGNRSAIQTKTQGSTSFMYPLTQPSIYQPHHATLPPLQLNSPTSGTMFSKCTSGFYENRSLTWICPPEQEPDSQNLKIHPDWWTTTLKSDAQGSPFTLIHTCLKVFLLDGPIWWRFWQWAVEY